LLQPELFPTRILEPRGWIMKRDTRPVDLHKFKYEKMKSFMIEGIETIREGRSISLPEKRPAEWLIRMNTF
jgi:hypothetical protein